MEKIANEELRSIQEEIDNSYFQMKDQLRRLNAVKKEMNHHLSDDVAEIEKYLRSHERALLTFIDDYQA